MSGERDPLGRAFEVVAWMADQDGVDFGVRQVAEATGIPAASVHRTLAALERIGLLDRVGTSYAVGLELRRIGLRLAAGLNVDRIAAEPMAELAQAADEQAFLCFLDLRRRSVMFGPTVEASHALRYTIAPYRWEPLHAGASCLGALAFVDPDDLDLLRRTGELEEVATRSALNLAELDDAIRVAVARGCAVSVGRHTVGAVGVSAPVFDHLDRVMGSLMLTIPEHRYDPLEEPRLAELVKIAADRVSWKLGSTRALLSELGRR